MAGQSWNIYWDEYCTDTYLYGSEIICHRKDHVEFKNSLMAPGTIIRQWYSKTNYQIKKIEPALPMIDGEGDYEIIVNIDTPPTECCLVRLVFYDKYGEEAGSIAVRDKTAGFRCPLKTYSYCMQLVNGGVRAFHFHSIVIRELANGTD